MPTYIQKSQVLGKRHKEMSINPQLSVLSRAQKQATTIIAEVLTNKHNNHIYNCISVYVYCN